MTMFRQVAGLAVVGVLVVLLLVATGCGGRYLALRKMQKCAEFGDEELDLVDIQLTTLPPEIGKLTKLTWLHLDGNQLTTLPPEIGKLTKLVVLYLDRNPITDTDLEHLKSMKRLKELHLNGTKVTKQGVAALKQALPNCAIVSDF